MKPAVTGGKSWPRLHEHPPLPKPQRGARHQAFHTSVAAWFRSGVDSAVDFPLDVACPATSSSHQQDLSDTTLFCHCLSLGRFTERQFLANRDNQLAVAHGFGHELERFPVEF